MVRDTTAYTGANSSAWVFGLLAQAETQSPTNNTPGGLEGSYSRADYVGTQGNTLAYAFGAEADVINHSSGGITNSYGMISYVLNEGSGNIANGYGVYVAAPTNSGGGTISNYDGVYIANPQISGVSGAYALYSAGGPNYFGGYVGIGTATPAANLEVNGTAQFDLGVTFQQPATFPSGQTFPGAEVTGTVPQATTASTAGNASNLGGVLASNYARLDVGNSFSGNQSVSGQLLVGGSSSPTIPLEVRAAGVDALTVSSNGYVTVGEGGSGTHITTASTNTDFAGVITMPANQLSAQIPFNGIAFSSQPVCVVTPINNTYTLKLTYPASGPYTYATVSVGSNSSGFKFNYICVGNPS